MVVTKKYLDIKQLRQENGIWLIDEMSVNGIVSDPSHDPLIDQAIAHKMTNKAITPVVIKVLVSLFIFSGLILDL
ncbi:MAG TPA: hypothetical protein EYP03_04765, partial [Aquificae bacterium]|nr:hypothetical protein [Aquificota bacterium]